MNKIKIKIPIYEVTCTFIIEGNIDEVIRKYGIKKKWSQDWVLNENDKVHGYATPDYTVFYSRDHLTPNLISHEISHLIDFILTDKGIELSGETRAYLTGHVSEKIFEYAIKNNLLKWEKSVSKVPRVKKPKVKEDEKPSGFL